MTFYLRLVKHLFRKQRFRSDPQGDNNFFIANIPLRVSKKQFELLVNSDIHGLNLQEIDGLVEEVLMQSRDEDQSIPRILFDYYREEILSSITKFTSPVFFVVVAVLTLIIISRLFHFSKLTFSAMILIVIISICVISYTMMYHDCQSDLEVEQMIQLSKENSLNNPCKNYHGEHESYLTSIKAAVFGSSQNECLEHMRKTFKPSKKYCDPLDVFARWSAKIQMSYIASLTEDFFELIHKFTSSSNIMTKVVVWSFSLIFFAYLIISLVKNVVKCGFQGLFGALSTSPATSTSSSVKSETIDILSQKMDAILDENQQMKQELRFIRECSVERAIKNSPPSLKRHKLSSIKERRKIDSKNSSEDDTA